MTIEQDFAALQGRVAGLESRQRRVMWAGITTAALCLVWISSARTFAQDRQATSSDIDAARARFHELGSNQTGEVKAASLDDYYGAPMFSLWDGTSSHGGLAIVGDRSNLTLMNNTSDHGVSAWAGPTDATLVVTDANGMARIILGVNELGEAYLTMYDSKRHAKFHKRTR